MTLSDLTPAQRDLAIRANAAKLAGFVKLAETLADILKSQLGIK